jgi:hypothetical protein
MGDCVAIGNLCFRMARRFVSRMHALRSWFCQGWRFNPSMDPDQTYTPLKAEFRAYLHCQEGGQDSKQQRPIMGSSVAVATTVQCESMET